jgi:hypothetical protein
MTSLCGMRRDICIFKLKTNLLQPDMFAFPGSIYVAKKYGTYKFVIIMIQSSLLTTDKGAFNNLRGSK